MRWLAALLVLFWAGESVAGLYCVVDLSGRRCDFMDLDSCKKSAGKAGSCVLNRDGMMAPQGGAPYCLVESWRTECVYQDLAGCEQQTFSRKASCIPNPNLYQAPVDFSGEGHGRAGEGSGKAEDGGENSDGRFERKYLPSPDYKPAPGLR